MKKLLLDASELRIVPSHLPMLIHGKEGSGASLYTISVAAHLHAAGMRVLFLCGYPMAAQEFRSQAGAHGATARFFTKEHVSEFLACITDASDLVLMVKNAELFDDRIFAKVLESPRVLISGDIEACEARERILAASYQTKVLFADLLEERVHDLGAYSAAWIARDRHGVTKVQ